MKKARWQYTGDIDIRCGGMFYLDENDHDFIRVIKVTPASDCGGMDNRYLIEDGSIYMPDDDIKRMRETADICGCKLADNKDLLTAGGTLPFQSPEWRQIMLAAWDAYHGIDGATPHVVQLGREMPDTMRRANFLDDAEPDFKLRSNVNLYRWIKREFCQ